MILTLLVALIAAPPSLARQSIRDVPQLASKLVHHYECRMAMSVGDQFKEEFFKIDVKMAGHQNGEGKLILGNNTMSAAANSHSLQTTWQRDGKTIALAMMMFRNSPTSSFVLLVTDPSNESDRADLGCSAVTFADLPAHTNLPTGAAR